MVIEALVRIQLVKKRCKEVFGSQLESPYGGLFVHMPGAKQWTQPGLPRVTQARFTE